MPLRTTYLITIFLLLAIPHFAFVNAKYPGNKEFAGITADILNPDKLFEVLKKNVTIPLPENKEGITLPNPDQALKDASPKLQEVNKDIQQETGVDFSKLISWFAKVLKLFFLTIVDILDKVSNSLKPAS